MAAKKDAPALTVADVFDPEDCLALIVPPDMPFPDAIEQLAQRKELRGVFVVDAEHKLVGVVTRQDLLHWAANKLGVRDPDRDSWRDIYRVITATSVADACRHHSELSAVRPDDDLHDALVMMLDNELVTIPVVDDDGRILGDIRLTSILHKVLQAHR